MQLNEILEKNSLKTISEKTNISEENLEILFAGEFVMLRKVKTLGFISIIEREFQADLSAFRKQALEYYETHKEDNGVSLEIPVVESKKGKSSFLIFIMVILLATASWYFITQFDQKRLRGLLPFNEDTVLESSMKENVNNSELSIEHTISEEEQKVKQNKSTDTMIDITSTVEIQNEVERNESN
jgi:cytoskeletal protein RodZ